MRFSYDYREGYENKPEYRKVEHPGVTFFLKEYQMQGKDRFVAVAFIGKSKKVAWNYYYKTEAERQKKIDEQVSSLKSWQEYKAKAKAERSQPHSLKVGDVLVSSGGYEQTNVTAYQVVGLAGKSLVEIREIGVRSVPSEGGSSMSDHVKDSFGKSEVIRCKANSSNSVKARWGSAHKWDGERSYYRSWYG